MQVYAVKSVSQQVQELEFSIHDITPTAELLIIIERILNDVMRNYNICQKLWGPARKCSKAHLLRACRGPSGGAEPEEVAEQVWAHAATPESAGGEIGPLAGRDPTRHEGRRSGAAGDSGRVPPWLRKCRKGPESRRVVAPSRGAVRQRSWRRAAPGEYGSRPAIEGVSPGGAADRGGSRAVGPRTAGDARGVPPLRRSCRLGPDGSTVDTFCGAILGHGRGPPERIGDGARPRERVGATRRRGDGASREQTARLFDWRWSSGLWQTRKKRSE
ncbi:hypothetical protein NDU88_006784 [Pleurodeles waltl]|uniref:Uncharacterized protein n=1 Tax=Pleurodeles waltl TaxID=8319 RepID=A0AAV7QM39_PLEWA|nr:hypothetical protein NDU88_006784 [Pleurodeles waltl]